MGCHSTFSQPLVLLAGYGRQRLASHGGYNFDSQISCGHFCRAATENFRSVRSHRGKTKERIQEVTAGPAAAKEIRADGGE